jgi:hypothetical protein
MSARYLLDSDDDGHWYLVPMELQQQFTEFVYGDRGTDQPDGVVRLDGHPNNVTFTAPEEFGQPIGENA